MNEIKLSFDPPAALITLNRPEVRNALCPSLVESFQVALEKVAGRQDVAALIVTGQGKAFCAGADLKVLREPGLPVSREGARGLPQTDESVPGSIRVSKTRDCRGQRTCDRRRLWLDHRV